LGGETRAIESRGQLKPVGFAGNNSLKAWAIASYTRSTEHVAEAGPRLIKPYENRRKKEDAKFDFFD
jgi:hypothetical protein